MRHRRVLPAEELLNPVALAAVAVLAANDHVLKGAGVLPGWLTGKLSDVAGLFFFPLLLTALWRTARHLFRRDRRPLSRRLLAGAILATGAAFAALKLWPAAADAWVWLVPRLDPTGVVDRVRVAPDATDLLALPVLGLTWLFGRRFAGTTPPQDAAARGGEPGPNRVT